MRRVYSLVPYIDFLWNFFLIVFFLLVLALMQISKPKDNNIQLNAEYIVQLDWDEVMNDDVDLWMLDPQGVRVFFRNRASTMLSLDRDVRSKDDNMSGDTKVGTNREIITIRGKSAGRYGIAVMMYKKNRETYDRPTKCQVTVIKLNPYQQILYQEFVLIETGDVHNVAFLTIDDQGKIIMIDKENLEAEQIVFPADVENAVTHEQSRRPAR